MPRLKSAQAYTSVSEACSETWQALDAAWEMQAVGAGVSSLVALPHVCAAVLYKRPVRKYSSCLSCCMRSDIKHVYFCLLRCCTAPCCYQCQLYSKLCHGCQNVGLDASILGYLGIASLAEFNLFKRRLGHCFCVLQQNGSITDWTEGT